MKKSEQVTEECTAIVIDGVDVGRIENVDPAGNHGKRFFCAIDVEKVSGKKCGVFVHSAIGAGETEEEAIQNAIERTEDAVVAYLDALMKVRSNMIGEKVSK